MITAVMRILSKILSTSPMALFRLYLAKLWIHMSVVRMGSSNHQLPKTINRTYLATFATFILASLYGIFGLHLASGQPLNITSLATSSIYIYWRQFFYYNRKIWPQMDTVMIVCTFGSLFILMDFTLKRSIQIKYLFMIDRTKSRVKLAGKALSIYESTKLISMFDRLVVAYKLFGLIIFSFTIPYCEGMVFLVSQVYKAAVWSSIIFWMFGFLYIVIIMLLLIYLYLIHIILSGSCIQIRQQYICEQFGKLVDELNRKQPTTRRFERIWFCYTIFNRAVLSINLQLEAFNTFYTNYLTVIFLVYNIIQVMYAHVIFFCPATSTSMVLMKCLFAVFIMQTSTLLFGLIQYCARVVKRNGQIGKLNRAFAVHCLRGQRRYRLRVGVLLKMETLQWPRLLHLYAFKLFGNSRITSKTFYAMAINISGFFLFITKRMQ